MRSLAIPLPVTIRPMARVRCSTTRSARKTQPPVSMPLLTTPPGNDALRNNVDGRFNVAVGDEAGTGLGPSVNNCIAIGAPGAGPFATLNSTCFIGSIFGQPVSDPGTQTAVFVDQFNVVGI